MTQALYRKWRPQNWDEVVGQEHIIQTLHNAVAAERVAHAYLFAGPRGTGKTTTARLLAKAVNCLHPDLAHRPCNQCDHCLAINQGRFLDLIEIDAASNTSVEDVRDLRDKINFAPNQGRYKVYIIDEVHMLSTAAFNALLKTLEEPPPHAIFVLATTEVHKIPATVLSRCQPHEFRRIPVSEILTQLKKIAASENLTAEEEALTLVARQATGSLRDAISLLDQLASSGSEITLQLAHEVLGTATSLTVVDILDALLAHDPAACFNHLHRALDRGSDPRQLARQIVEYLRNLLLIKVSSADLLDTPKDIRARMAEHAHSLSTAHILHAIRAFNDAAAQARLTWQPSLPLEMAILEAMDGPSARPATPQTDSLPQTSPRRTPAATAAGGAAPQRAASPPSVPSPSSSSQITLQTLRENWAKITSAVRKYNTSTQGLLNTCTLLDLRDNDLYLGFASEVLKSKMEKPENTQATLKSIADVLGVNLHLRCVISTDQGAEIPPEVDSQSMVAAAVRLGGEIVDSRDIPPTQTQ